MRKVIFTGSLFFLCLIFGVSCVKAKETGSVPSAQQQAAAPVATIARGTLVSGKSLLRQVDDQTGEDVAQVGQAATKAVKDIRNKLLPKRNDHINPQERN